MEGATRGIAQVRYPTAGGYNIDEAQPFFTDSPGITLVHNGNLVNASVLRKELLSRGRHLNTGSDSEVLLGVLAEEILCGWQSEKKLDSEQVFSAISRFSKRVVGAYSVIAEIYSPAGLSMVAFRDPNGIRPLVFGTRNPKEYMFASESVALSTIGFTVFEDIKPGEAVYIDSDGELSRKQYADTVRHTPCIFEYAYLARPDSLIEDVSVYKARVRMGEYLGQKILREWPDHDIDVVIPIPATGCQIAPSLASVLGIKFREGFYKSPYVYRTFIMPQQGIREACVRLKLSPIGMEFTGKNVLLVDDSIVRGTTSNQIIEMARKSGAKKVYFASASPPVRFPNVYGIDMPSSCELVAYERTTEDVCRLIGADRLIYQDLSDLHRAVRVGNPLLTDFEDSIFTGEYITGESIEEYLATLQCRHKKIS
jgi:amidophosphoribosyltransferase